MAIIDVRDFGALGDGTTDDTAAIQAAVDAAVSGDFIFVPAGDHRLGATLAMATDNVTLFGVGPRSILRLLDGVKVSVIAVPAFDIGGPLALVRPIGVTISDLTLSCNYNPIAEFGVEPDYFPLMVRQSEGLTVARVIATDCSSDGITISNGNMPNVDVTVEDCRVKARRSGIHVGFVQGCVIRRCHIVDTPDQHYGASAAHGVDVEVEGYDLEGEEPHLPWVDDLTIEDCLIVREDAETGEAGIALQSAYGPVSNVTIARNVISGHGNALLIQPADVGMVTFEDNWLTIRAGYELSGTPVAMNSATSVIIRRNTHNDPVGNFSNGLMNAIACDGLTVADNVFRARIDGPTNYVLKVEGGCTGVSVTGNQHRTQSDLLLSGEDAGSVTASGNTALPASPWDRTEPASPTFDVSEGATISAATDVTATVTDADSAIARVFFAVDGVPAGHSDAAPHVLAFDPADYPSGDHVLSARAIDGSANLGPEASVTITTGSDTDVLDEAGFPILDEGGFSILDESDPDPDPDPVPTDSDSILILTAPDGGIFLYAVPN